MRLFRLARILALPALLVLGAGAVSAQDTAHEPLDHIRDAALTAARTQVSAAAELSAGRLDERLRLPACPAPLAAQVLSANGAALSVEVRCDAAGWKLFVPVSVREQVKVLVAARALTRANAHGFFPDLGLGANAVRNKPSAGNQTGFSSAPYTLYGTKGTLSYEPDLFSRVKDIEKAYSLDAQAQEATYRSVLLALQADIAQAYFSIRATDSDIALLRDIVAVQVKAADIMGKRLKAGYVGEADFTDVQSGLEAARADLTAVKRQRAALEHALAVTLGRLPSEFSLTEMPLDKEVLPEIPAGLPSSLLTRRPDIAAALDSMAAANARIGAARAASFPDLSLSASGGTEASVIGSLFQWSARTWALGQVGGALLSLPVFDNGRRSANIDRARAAYDEALANYRTTVLTAFREVEDGLSGQRLLERQFRQQASAAKAATRSTALARKRFDAGDIDYLNLAAAQRTSLTTERVATQVHGQRYIALITLVRAMGGGWEQK